jgi:hypothetical protein
MKVLPEPLMQQSVGTNANIEMLDINRSSLCRWWADTRLEFYSALPQAVLDIIGSATNPLGYHQTLTSLFAHPSFSHIPTKESKELQ